MGIMAQIFLCTIATGGIRGGGKRGDKIAFLIRVNILAILLREEAGQ